MNDKPTKTAYDVSVDVHVFTLRRSRPSVKNPTAAIGTGKTATPLTANAAASNTAEVAFACVRVCARV
jgi:hypothetical protein